MSRMNNMLSMNKLALLMTTSLVVAGCNTTDNTPAASNTMEPPKAPVASVPQSATKGMSVQSLMRIADRAWKKGSPATALRLYTMAAHKSPKNPAPVLAMADILRKTKKPDAAIELYKSVLETSPDVIAAHTGIGYSLLNQDKPYMAAQSFESAIALDPNNARSLGGMAVSLDTAGEHGKAQDYYRLAIKADTNNLTYQNNLALSLALSGRTDQAIAMLEIITTHPHANAKHRQNLALVYGMAGKSADAMRYSRMDLSEKEARNNALYFKALNQNTSDNLKEQEQQASLIAQHNNIEYRAPETSRKPHNLLVAREESTELNTVAQVAETKSTLPTIPRTPHFEQYAKAPAPAEMVASIGEQQPKTEGPKVAAAPVADVEADALSKPVTYSKVDPDFSSFDTPTAKNEVFAPKAEVSSANTVADIPEKVDMKSEDTSLAKADITPVVEHNNFEATDKVIGEQVRTHDYYIQLGSFKSEDRANRGWSLLQKRHSDLLGDHKPLIAKVELGEEKGTFYRVRVGAFSNAATPMTICETLISRSEACYTPRVRIDTVENQTNEQKSSPPTPENVVAAIVDPTTHYSTLRSYNQEWSQRITDIGSGSY